MMIRVEVWGETIDLAVHQQSKSVWLARGEYKGKAYEGKGRSPSTAAASWHEQARYFSN
ncbi:hypothetical protein [Methylobacterium sp. J-077]|uniref:hypothetical protein n=1 Tax=Methylobacterium sp. J-077 TaxID=2836656 RepID=UPI001FBA1650|nr:hypothetical protein [Methylobacterium sp. J-077]MCJ2124757.1 hypothetical protein [Methylobacterium sp. J-077]